MSDRMSVDLHIHSTMSDGTMSPTEIVDLAYKKGLSCIALTDHDTVAGNQEAQERGDVVGLEVISGMELSVSFEEFNVHLLGYLIDSENVSLLRSLHTLQEARETRNREILHILEVSGIHITEKELQKVSGTGQTGRPHIAKILMEKKVVRSMDEAFEKYLGRDGSAYVSRFVLDMKSAVDVIHKAGGLAVVAHPYHLIKNDMISGEILFRLKELGVDGIETYYPTHSRKFRKQLIKLAEKYGLLLTGGSDYHGTIRRGTTLAGGKGVSVPAELVEIMRRTRNVHQGMSIK
ncbi:MAG: putative metal-dependent phosphoesterase TrpH [Desulforhopalus sp.]|jgi:predicted metal-dependent phosphoesterase TrpH